MYWRLLPHAVLQVTYQCCAQPSGKSERKCSLRESKDRGVSLASNVKRATPLETCAEYLQQLIVGYPS
jgi:hypothetical protein